MASKATQKQHPNAMTDTKFTDNEAEALVENGDAYFNSSGELVRKEDGQTFVLTTQGGKGYFVAGTNPTASSGSSGGSSSGGSNSYSNQQKALLAAYLLKNPTEAMKKKAQEAYGISNEQATSATTQSASELAAEEWALQQQYLPQEMQLAIDLAAKYQPQQYEQMLQWQQTYGPQFQEVANQLASQQRAAELSDVEKYAALIPGLLEKGESPETTALRKTLMGQISDELSMGSQLTAEQQRQVNQATRSGQLARGMGYGQGDVNREAVATSLAGQDLLNQRQSKASQMLAQEYQRVGNPFDTILNRSTAGTNQAYASLGTSMYQPTQAAQSPSVQAVPYGLSQTGLSNQLYGTNMSGYTNIYGTNMNAMTGIYNTNQQAAISQEQLAMQQKQYEASMYAANLYGQSLGIPYIPYN